LSAIKTAASFSIHPVKPLSRLLVQARPLAPRADARAIAAGKAVVVIEKKSREMQ
jgi:hypothetical protein